MEKKVVLHKTFYFKVCSEFPFSEGSCHIKTRHLIGIAYQSTDLITNFYWEVLRNFLFHSLLTYISLSKLLELLMLCKFVNKK